MKCYRCNNVLNESDEVCSKCGSKVIRYSSNKVKKVSYPGWDYYSLARSFLVTKFLSYLIGLIFPLNLVIPWLLLSIICAMVSYFKYKCDKALKIIIIDAVLIVIEIVLLILFFNKIYSFLIS